MRALLTKNKTIHEAHEKTRTEGFFSVASCDFVDCGPFFEVCLFLLVSLLALAYSGLKTETHTQRQAQQIRVAILDFGKGALGQRAAEKLTGNLKLESGLVLMDQDQTRAAANGAGYSGSLNLSLAEARDLGAALGSDFFVVGDAQTLRRSPSTGQPYFESYASVFVVSARTGKLVVWQRPNFRAATPDAAEQSLLLELTSAETRHKIGLAIRRAHEDERGERTLAVERQTPIIEAAPDDEKKAEEDGLRLPRPFRRLVPAYPDTAAEAEAEATVDVLADIDAKGEVTRVEIARWAGFGLDESTVATVKRIKFFPAMRNGVAIPLRVLLRYNFRKPAK
ncbi:MAG TPA: energy transducer TonB [Pyrinomonadaceae bacterium]|nr:energy transducer TonB [Pyrinomonadaceae bacterium]